MNPDSSHADELSAPSLPLDLVREIDHVCDNFSEALKLGQNPRIEDYLARIAAAGRSALLCELVVTELEFQFARGMRPDGEPFYSRFPDDRPAVDAALARLAMIVAAPRGPQMADASAPTAIRYFGDYELLQEIARGGMGIVYKARQVTLNRIVAVKMILSGQFAGPEDISRFHVEAEAAAQLDHPGIVPIFEIGEHAGQHYFSMGFVEGQSLADRLAQGPLSPRDAAEIVRAVAEAVHYSHSKGVIHRDLKPGNILLDHGARPRVTDFGLARFTAGSRDLTGSSQILGTPAYMAPEQACPALGEIGPATDIYALGAVLYCLLTGRPPFQAASQVETLLQVLEQEPALPRQLNASIPPDLETISLKCLRKCAPHRYATMAALATDLTSWLNGEPIQARPTGIFRRVNLWIRRHQIPVSAASASIPLAGLTAFLLMRLPEAASSIVLSAMTIGLLLGFALLPPVLLYVAYQMRSSGVIRALRQLEVLLEDIEMTSVRLMALDRIPLPAKRAFCREAIRIYERVSLRRDMPQNAALLANLAAARLRELEQTKLAGGYDPELEPTAPTPGSSVTTETDLRCLAQRDLAGAIPLSTPSRVRLRLELLTVIICVTVFSVLTVWVKAESHPILRILPEMFAVVSISLIVAVWRSQAPQWYLRRRMQHADPFVRLRSIEYAQIHRLNSRRTVRALSNCLHDQDANVRIAAARALAPMGVAAMSARPELCAFARRSDMAGAAEAIRARQIIDLDAQNRAACRRLFVPHAIRGTLISAIIALSIGAVAPLAARWSWPEFLTIAAAISAAGGLVHVIVFVLPPRRRLAPSSSLAMFGLSITGSRILLGTVLTGIGALSIVFNRTDQDPRIWCVLVVGMLLLLNGVVPVPSFRTGTRPDTTTDRIPRPIDTANPAGE